MKRESYKERDVGELEKNEHETRETSAVYEPAYIDGDQGNEVVDEQRQPPFPSMSEHCNKKPYAAEDVQHVEPPDIRGHVMMRVSDPGKRSVPQPRLVPEDHGTPDKPSHVQDQFPCSFSELGSSNWY